MMKNKMEICADMIFTDAVEDMAAEEKISFRQARDRIILSGAYACLYDFDSGMWMEGPDSLRDLVRRIEENKK